MLDYILAALGGVIAGFLLSKLIKIIRMNAYHKDVVDSIVRSLALEEEFAQSLGEGSMIEYVVQKKGMDYAILYYGSIYHLLQGVSKKDAETERLTEVLSLFLHEALKEDIEKYREGKLAQEKAKADGKRKKK